ncbi:MAG: sn-glycerol-3-phosphate ABC transporter ATP-binding protein UgpC [Acidobacteria bacterium]|nr:sn-glycerol-3-phosphate ABC transporter ATP-binding protein UgpC [Acidobacteriota bacterium]
MAAVRLDAVAKTYPGGHTAVRHVDLDIDEGEFLVLVGPSGCGKSTLLRLIAGLETPTSGRILIGGADVTALPPQARDLAMVFQSYALYPHMSVRDNLAYGLKVRRTDRTVVAQRVADVAAALDIEALLDRRPAQLSGGQRQRVALGRAMVRQPKAFLLDEPLSNLDPALRAQARAELRRLHRRLGVTVVYVTHDQVEAMTLGGRVAVMREGVIEQVAPPLDVYARPVSTFVARFIGAPAMNLVPATLGGIDAPPGAVIGIRPQDVALGAGGQLHATVDLVEPRGHDYLLHLRLDSPEASPFLAVVAGAAPPPTGAQVLVTLPPDRLHLFDARDGTRLG